MLLLSDTYSMVPILVHEFQEAACNQQPELILKRARLYRVMLPPNQLNPQGYYDGTLDAAFLSRYDKKKKGGKSDLRASARQIPLPAPGESALAWCCWTMKLGVLPSCGLCRSAACATHRSCCGVLSDMPS